MMTRKTGWLLALVAVLVGCSAESDDGVRTAQQNLTEQQSRVLGFEAPTTDWAAPNGSPITASTDVTQGSHSLAVTINGYTEIISTQIAAPSSPRPQATFDIKPAQQLPWGEARLVVVMPSQGHHWRDLGGVPLTGLTAGQFHTLSFSIPGDVQAALGSSGTDLSFRIIINGPSGLQFIVDNLIVSDGGGSSPGDPGATGQAFSLSVPRGSRVQDVIISGTGKVTIDDRSTISEQQAPATVSSIGPERSEFGAGVNVYGNVVSKGDVDFLRSGSQITGTLTTEGTVLQQNNVVVGGGIFTGVPVQNATTEWSVNWPAGAGQNVSLPPDSPNFDLAPGHYGSVQAYSRATITLRSGVYFVDSFVLEPQVNFKVDASAGLVQIYVRDTLRLRSSIEYVGGEEGQVLFGYLGTEPALYEEAIVAAIVAPNSAIELRRPASGLPHKGSFFGQEVHVFSDATVLHIPIDLTFVCPSGDFDGDGILNCSDECWDDPAKIVPGICGCSTPDTDTDGDGVPDCVDQCPTDPKNTYRGMCGCADEPDVAPAGTPCNDGIARGTFTCDGEGTCGNPDDDAPEGDGGTGQGGCFHKTLGTTVYWICSGDPTGSTQEDATLTCGRPDRKLARIDTQQENALIASLVGAPSWIGGNDRQTEGEWFWTDSEGADATRFWADGKARPGAFASWRGGAPGTDDSKNCSTISSDGRWDDEDCNEPRPYVCEGVFGSTRSVGSGRFRPRTKDFCDIIPGWLASSNGIFGCGGSDTDGLNDPLCTDPPSSSDFEAWVIGHQQDNEFCDAHCGDGTAILKPVCDQMCEQEYLKVPPELSTCIEPGAPLAELELIDVGSCAMLDPATLEGTEEEIAAAVAAAQDCSDATILVGPIPIQGLRCGVKTKCLHLDEDNLGNLSPRPCGASSDCNAGHTCDLRSKRCVDPAISNACQTDPASSLTMDRKDQNDVCVGRCFADVGCGLTAEDIERFINPGNFPVEPDRCDETLFCGPEYTDEPDITSLGGHVELTDEDFPNAEDAEVPQYSSDFETPCLPGDLSCGEICLDGPLGEPPDPMCLRRIRHSWCSNDAVSTGVGSHRQADEEQSAERGTSDTPLKFTIEPDSVLDFRLSPLPFGTADFRTNAAAGVRALVDFNVLGARGSVEIIDLRADIEASICHVSTENSRLEVVGVDFLPQLAGTAVFHSDDVLPGVQVDGETKAASEACQEAVFAYVDAFDRTKKALRDAQELIHQYTLLKADGRTFDDSFCETVAGVGMRPEGMGGSCPETPEETINHFIKFYTVQATELLPDAVSRLKEAALSSSNLGSALGVSANSDYAAFIPIDAGGEESVTIVALQFFIGPIPAVLEVAAYAHYGIGGGFGVDLKPEALVGSGGEFVLVGAEVGPYANSGVTLYVGVGFNVGVLELSAGVEGGVTLGEVSLPASVSAGISMVPQPEDEAERPIPHDLAPYAHEDLLFPPQGHAQRYGFNFNYKYGVDFHVDNILSGFINGVLKVKFAFFKKKYSQRLASFSSGLEIGPMQLIGGEGDSTIVDGGAPALGNPFWRNSFESIPFVRLRELPSLSDAERGSLAANAPVDLARAVELYYDSLCAACKQTGQQCGRDADCCVESDSCRLEADNIKRCGVPACVPSGQSCGAGDECCQEGHSCNAGVCGVIVCQPLGESCNAPEDCCNGSCISGICQTIVR